MQGGFELPTRLSVAAADFVIALSVALTRKDMVSNIPDKKMKSSNISAPNLRNTLVATAVNKEVKPTIIPSELASDLEMKMQLWRLLDELIILMQRLLAVCSQFIFYTFILQQFLHFVWKDSDSDTDLDAT